MLLPHHPSPAAWNPPLVRTSSPHLAVIDTDLPDIGTLDLVSELLRIDAMVNTAVVSGFSDGEFHEASEGLGVLSKLTLNPGREEAIELLQKLHRVLGSNNPT